jgi:hypothetical protein
MSGPGALPPEIEIANLEHELTVLRERYANLLVESERMKRVSKYSLIAIWGTVIGGLIYAAATTGDPFAMLIALGAVVVTGLIAWFYKDWFPDDEKSGFRFSEDRCPFQTDEEFLNHAIAIREQRLLELKAIS